jgi:hypothetical protein
MQFLLFLLFLCNFFEEVASFLPPDLFLLFYVLEDLIYLLVDLGLLE